MLPTKEKGSLSLPLSLLPLNAEGASALYRLSAGRPYDRSGWWSRRGFGSGRRHRLITRSLRLRRKLHALRQRIKLVQAFQVIIRRALRRLKHAVNL